MPLAEENNMVKALPPDRTDQPFSICVLPWRARRRRSITNAHGVLALEIEASRRPADGAAGNTRADPRGEHRQSTVGSATNSWRAAQARHRNLTDQRGQVYGQAEGPPSQGWKTFLRKRRWICSSYRRSHFACSMAC